MAKWIAFTETGVRALARRIHGQVELGIGEPIAVALEAPTTAMVLLPAGEDRVTVIKMRRTNPRETQQHVGTGFLGLTEIAAEEELPSRERKSWWRRMLAR